MKRNILILSFVLIVMSVSAQTGQKRKYSADVNKIEAAIGKSTNLVDLRNDKPFLNMLKKVVSRGDAGSIYIIDKYSTMVYACGLKAEVGQSLDKMSETVKDSEVGLRILDKYYRVRGLAVGVKVPDFTLTTPDGKSINLYSFIKGKKCVVLDFWASWCGWCRKESPMVKKVYNEYHGTDFDVISVSFDEKKSEWINAIKTDGTDWTQVSDLKGTKGYIYAWYDLNSIPAIFLIDGEGHVLAKGMRGQVIEEKVKQTLNK